VKADEVLKHQVQPLGRYLARAVVVQVHTPPEAAAAEAVRVQVTVAGATVKALVAPFPKVPVMTTLPAVVKVVIVGSPSLAAAAGASHVTAPVVVPRIEEDRMSLKEHTAAATAAAVVLRP
jgi:hypothetical protein